MTQKPRPRRKIAAILIVAILLTIAIFMNSLTSRDIRGNWWGIVGVFLFSCALFLIPDESVEVDNWRWSDINITEGSRMA